MPQSRLRSILEEQKRKNLHDPNWHEWSAERISHWSEPNISFHRVKRILAGAAPFEWEADAIINTIGGELRKMLPIDIFGEILGRPIEASSTSRFGSAIPDDAEPSKDQSFHQGEVPSATFQ